MLDQSLFVIYINFLDENVGSMNSQFVNDVKIGDEVDGEESYLRLQQYLVQTREEWQMVFNSDKCKMVHFS